MKISHFELKRRAMAAYWQTIGEGVFRAANEPSFNESYVEEDSATERIYIVLRDSHGNFIKVYRFNSNQALKTLARIPRFMRPTNGQTAPLN